MLTARQLSCDSSYTTRGSGFAYAQRVEDELGCPLCGGTGGEWQFDVGHSFALVACRCGLRRLWPVPTHDDLDAFYSPHYYSYVACQRPPLKQRIWTLLRDSASARQRRVGGPARPLLRALARQQFDVLVSAGPQTRALDIGCGNGDLLAYLRSRGAEVVGVERDERSVAAARAAGLQVFVGELRDAPVPPKHFSDAILQHSLEHIHRPRETLKLIRNAMAASGRVHIAVPNGASAGLRLQRADWGHLSFPGHLWFFDFEAVTRLLEDNGFRVIQRRYKVTWSFHRSALRDALKARSRQDCVAVARTLAIMLIAPDRRDVLRVVAAAE